MHDNRMQGGYEKLEVYQRSMALLNDVQAIIQQLPREERYDLARQMRRAAKSIPANIAEGYARRTSSKEFARHLRIALGSANEMEVNIKVARQLGYVDAERCNEVIREYVILGKQLRKLMNYWRSKVDE